MRAQSTLIEDLLQTIESWRQTDQQKGTVRGQREEIAALYHEEAHAREACQELRDMCWELAAARGCRERLGSLCQQDEDAWGRALEVQRSEIQALRWELAEAREARGEVQELACNLQAQLRQKAQEQFV